MVDTATAPIIHPITIPDAEAKEEKSNAMTSKSDAPAATEADVAQDNFECGASDDAPSASCRLVSAKSSAANRPARVSISNDEGSASAEGATPTSEEDGHFATTISTVVSNDDSTASSTEKTVDSSTVATGTESTAPFVVKSDEASSAAVSKKRKANSVQFLINGPNIAPKKNKTPFMLFSMYAKIWCQVNIPGLKGTELTKYIRAHWDKMETDKDSRDYWDERAKEDKARYEKELVHYRLYLVQRKKLADAADSSTGSGDEKMVEDLDASEALTEVGEDDTEQSRAKSKSNLKDPASASTTEEVGDDTKQRGAKASLKDPADHAAEKEQAEEGGGAGKATPTKAFTLYEEYASNFIKSRQPYVKDVKVAKAVQCGWNAMNSKERTYWEEKAAADQQSRFQKEVAAYVQQKGTSQGVTEIGGVKVAFL